MENYNGIELATDSEIGVGYKPYMVFVARNFLGSFDTRQEAERYLAKAVREDTAFCKAYDC